MKIKRGSTSVRRLIFLADASSTTGEGLADLVHNSAGLVAYYIAGDLSNDVPIALATATLGTWTSGGFVAVDNTNMPGWYEIGIPNEALDGGNEVAIQLRGAADMVPVNLYIELDAVDYQLPRFGALDETETDAVVATAILDWGTDQGFTDAFSTTVLSILNDTPTVAQFNARTLPSSSYFTTLGANAPAGWINAAAFASGAITSTVIASNAIGASQIASNAIAAAKIASNALSAAKFAADAIAAIQNGLMLATSYTAPDNAGIVSLNDRLTATRAGYLDKLNVTGVVASQADINAINQSASRRVILQTVGQWERPETSSTVYVIELRTFDEDGAAVNADTTPTMSVTGTVSGSLAANLAAPTNPATGVYRWNYTVQSAATIEPVRCDASATTAGSAFPMSVYTQVTDFMSVDFTSSDRTKLDAIFNKLPSRAFLSGTTSASGAVLPADLGLAAANLDTQLTTIATNATAARTAAESADGKLTAPRLAKIDGAAQAGADDDTLKTLSDQIDLTATTTGVSSLFTTLTTKLRKFVQLIVRKDAGIATDNATEVSEINANGGNGAGSFANATDALEALRDRGDEAWISGGGSGGGSVVGSGADQVSIYIKDDGIGVPDVSVWITSDSVGATVIAGTLITDAEGKVLFLLDAGTTYYLWAKKSGKISITGQPFVAVADT